MKEITFRSHFDNTKLRATMTRLYYWLMKLFVISHIYYGDVSVAQSFCNQVIASISNDKNLAEDFIFLKGVALLQVKPGSENQSGIENLRVLSTVTTHSTKLWRWKVSYFNRFSLSCGKRSLELSFSKIVIVISFTINTFSL